MLQQETDLAPDTHKHEESQDTKSDTPHTETAGSTTADAQTSDLTHDSTLDTQNTLSTEQDQEVSLTVDTAEEEKIIENDLIAEPAEEAVREGDSVGSWQGTIEGHVEVVSEREEDNTEACRQRLLRHIHKLQCCVDEQLALVDEQVTGEIYLITTSYT